MKDIFEGKKRERESLKKRIERLKKEPFRCPFCREVFKGIKELIPHLKTHCR